MPRTSVRARVAAAHAAGHTVRESRTAQHASLILEAPMAGARPRGRPLGALQLMRDGVLTEAGKHYERVTGAPLVRPASWASTPFLVGNTQWISVTGQGRRKLSRFIRGREILTKWGKRWYSENPQEYIINVPVRQTIRRRNGTLYRQPPSTIPVEWTTKAHESDGNFHTQMLAFVHSKLPDHYTYVSIHEIEVLYDTPAKDWQISSKRVSIGADGRVSFETKLDQPLHAYDGRQSYTAKPHNIVDLAFRSGVQTGHDLAYVNTSIWLLAAYFMF